MDARLDWEALRAEIAAWGRAYNARRAPFGPEPFWSAPSHLESSNILGIRGSGTI